ncbi:MAG: hypothetical protein Q8Q07_04645 [Dehalococcoidales bacterium]|nr:hypothetical protein [Dehalococcoidales bacterium]MDZ4230242.1 hypothetical protein [Dehalococcoidales bacterium]
MGKQEQSGDRGIRFKIIIVWLAIVLLGSFWLTVQGSLEPVSIGIIPQVPREGESIMVTYRLNNQSPEVLVTRYQFYADGKLLKEGVTMIVPGFGKVYRYAYENPVPLGERLNFLVRTQSEQGEYEKYLSTPPFPPQVWSSFVSFASFSTSVMSFMTTTSYYQSTFGSSVGFNVGLIFAVILIVLLILLELTHPFLHRKTDAILHKLRLNFNTVTWVLFIIFMGVLYTRVVMILNI